jgi:phosphosulfolactate synthase (CoM biosynthesis protein A)
MELPGTDREKAFGFLRIAPRPPKPRETGVTEVRDRGMGIRSLQDLLEAAGEYIDILKFAGGVQRLQNRDFIRRKISLARENEIEVSTGGLLERVILQGQEAVYQFLEEARELGFSIVEVSSGLLILPLAHKQEIIKLVREYGLKPKPEVAMAYGIMPGERVSVSADMLIKEIGACLEAGA